MNCISCGGEMVATRENHRYDSCGLAGVTLEGVEIRRCHDCGDKEVSIPDIEGLHRALAKCIIEKRPRLAPAEIRFLRRYLGLSGVDLAQQMGVEPETISRWEGGQQRMGGPAERLLRMMVAGAEQITEPTNWLADVAQEEPAAELKPGVFVFDAPGRGWLPEPCYT